MAAPVIVIDSLRIRSQLGTGVADLLRSEPGVDVVGTGANQVRPAIRGQRGQRILLLEDGMRLNNSRRQQDFGELPALVDADQLARVEVVRGPASVLYGTDAIGGVVNLITRAPNFGPAANASGRLGYMAAALFDRLVHHCHIVNIRGNSDRMRHHSELSRALGTPRSDTPPRSRSRAKEAAAS